MRVTKGMDAMSIKTRIAGERASKKGLLMRRWVARVSVEDVVWIWQGRSSSLRAVIREKTKGMIANSRSLRKLLESNNEKKREM